MGACATKPKVLKDDDEKPISQPEPPPQKEVVEEKKEEVVPRPEAAIASSVVNDATVAAPVVVESDLPKNPSLGNLFDKESKDAKVSPGIESEKEKAASSSQESDPIKAPEVVASGNTQALEILPTLSATGVVPDASLEKEAINAPDEVIASEDAKALPVAPEVVASGNTQALEILPTPSATVVVPDAPVEKEAINAPNEVIANEDAKALPVPPTEISVDVPVEKEAAIIAPEISANKPSGTIVDAPVAKENDGPAEKLDSKTSEIVPEDFADALPAPVVAADAPVDDAAPEIVTKENANASTENVKEENVGEKSIADTEEVYFPTNKIVSQYSGEYTDALPDAVAPTLNNNAFPLQIIEQSGEEKLNPAQEDTKPLNIENKKAVEVENAVEKQAESLNPTQESDVKEVKPVEILPDKTS